MKKIIIFLFSLIILIPKFCFSNEINAPVSLVKKYVNDMGENILEKGTAFQAYYHPDYVLLGGEKNNYVIVSRKFRVGKVYTADLDLNIIHPGKEKLIAVEIIFNQIGQFDGSHRVHIKKEKWVKTFYCTKATGKYLIIDTTDNEALWCFCGSAIKWLIKNNSDENKNAKAIADLKATNCK